MPRYRQSERRWVHAACVAGVYPVLVATLFVLKVGGGVNVPLSVAVSAPPLIYAAASMLLLREAAFIRRLSWVGGACVVHLGLGVLAATELAWAAGLAFPAALAQVFVLFPPASVLTLVATPIALWAFGLTDSKPASRSEAAPRPVPPARPKPMTAPSRPARLMAEATTPPAPPVRPAPSFSAPGASPLAARPSLPTTPSASAPVVVPPPAPPLVAAAPAAPVASAPPKPTPRRDDGMVRVSFARLAPQLPAEAFVLPIERLGESLREPNVVLVPRRVVLSQMSGGAVAITWGHIASQFPELALGLSDDEFRQHYPDLKLWLPADELAAQLPAGTVPGTPAADSSVDAPVAVAPPALDTAPPPAHGSPTRPVMPANGPAPTPIHEVSQKDAVAKSPEADRQDRAILERVLACFSGVGGFEPAVERLGGNRVVTLVEPGVPRDAVSACAGQLLRSLAGGPGDVVTAWTAHAVVVLAVAATPVVVAARLPGVPAALLGIRAMRAAAAAGGGAPAVPALPRRGLESVAVDRRMTEAAQALRSLGAAEPTAFADGAARVYVFRAGGAEDKAIAILALDICDALGAGGALGRVHAAMLRRGGGQTLVRPLTGAAGVLAASGTVTRPGRLLRDAERAAAILESA